MATVNTVLGPVDTADLGFTLSHEHVCMGIPGIRQSYPDFGDLQAVLDEGAAELKKAFDGGVRTIIDLTTIDQGRDVEALAEASRRSGVHIIGATGNHLSIPFVLASEAYSPPFLGCRLGHRHPGLSASSLPYRGVWVQPSMASESAHSP